METNLRQLYNLNLVTLKRQRKERNCYTGKQDKLMGFRRNRRLILNFERRHYGDFGKKKKT